MQDDDTRFYYIKLITAILAPFAFSLVAYFFWQIKGCISRMSQQSLHDRAILTVTVIQFLMYPSVVNLLVSSINCTQIEDQILLYDDLQ